LEIDQLVNLLKIEAGTIIIGWIAVVIGLVLKDILTSLAFGIMFYLDPQFVEGDVVYIDGEKAIIQKIGISVTIFKIYDTSRWRYIKNEKIRYHKLEKQVEKI
jgi:small-conductance mechanosensitive channel